MTKWQDYFTVEEYTQESVDLSYFHRYKLIVKSTGQIVGNYKDMTYACKQAKYKFKKMSKQVEEILLG
jgi:hypothetical protein